MPFLYVCMCVCGKGGEPSGEGGRVAGGRREATLEDSIC